MEDKLLQFLLFLLTRKLDFACQLFRYYFISEAFAWDIFKGRLKSFTSGGHIQNIFLLHY